MTTLVVCTELSGKTRHRQVGVGRVVTSGNIGGEMVIVVVCTDLSGKEMHEQVDVDRMVTSGSLRGVMVGTLAWYSIPTLGAIFTIFITHNTRCHDQDPA